MFTLIPSLYLLGVQYFRQWNAPIISNDDSQPTKILADVPKVKSTKKKTHRQQRRKTSISALSQDDIEYLKKQTDFAEEKILVWYSEYLVSDESNVSIIGGFIFDSIA